MTDPHASTADLSAAGGDGEQGPMPDDPQGALSMDVSDPGSSGDGGSEQMPHEDPPLAPSIMEGNPGGDGSTEETPNEDPPPAPGIHLDAGDSPGGDGSTEESPPEDPPPSGALHEITAG